MSNKLVKSKSNMEKKLEYYKRHCRTLEKEIGMLQAEKENLKKENVELQLKLGIDLEHIKQNNAMDRKVIANALYSQKLFNDGKAEMDGALAVLTNEIEKAKELNKEYKDITDALLEEMFNKDNYKK
ncbi:MAG: hypothetical protein ACLVCT_02830 [Lachnospira sp.]